MKRMKMVLGVMMIMVGFMAAGQAKMDDARMEQDIEVAENILTTLLRQQFNRRNFFPMEVNGTYMAGYGVTFRLPRGGMFLYKTMGDAEIIFNNGPDAMTYSTRRGKEEAEEKANLKKDRTTVTRSKSPTAIAYTVTGSDSLAADTDKRFLEAVKSFLADYGDVISQLKPEERIVVTNRGDGFDGDFNFNFKWNGGESRRSLISAEAKKDDINQLKQGKITRDQFLTRLNIVNTESSDKLDPDLEVLSSMFGRLYREDLSKTYYNQEQVGYERMKDFGVIYYMRVYSSNEEGEGHWSMPTVGANHLNQADRDKKVKELYPKFESEFKENLVEYGRILHSLKDDEQVVFNVKLTKCAGCEIPTSLEFSVKNSVLKDYSASKITKEAALAKVSVKKVGSQ